MIDGPAIDRIYIRTRGRRSKSGSLAWRRCAGPRRRSLVAARRPGSSFEIDIAPRGARIFQLQNRLIWVSFVVKNAAAPTRIKLGNGSGVGNKQILGEDRTLVKLPQGSARRILLTVANRPRRKD
jgi:hypothetical protein